MKTTEITPFAAAVYGNLINAGLMADYTQPPGNCTELALISFAATPAVGSRYYFGSFPLANNLTAITATTATQLPVIFDGQTAYNTATADQYADAVLTLVTRDGRRPTVLSLNALTLDANNQKPVFVNLYIDWRASYIEFTATAGGITTAEAFYLTLYYNN